jgi:hypothetical protein
MYVRYDEVDEFCIGPSRLVTVGPGRLDELQFRTDRTFVLLFRNHEILTFVRSAGSETVTPLQGASWQTQQQPELWPPVVETMS